MPADNREITVASALEASFGAGPTVDWDTNGTVFAAIDPTFEELRRGTHENKNYRQRVLASKAKLLGVQTGKIAFGLYAGGTGVETASGANAATTHTADMLHNAWGGRRLTRANAAVGPFSSSTVEVGAGEGVQYEPGDLIVCGSGGTGNFYILVVDSVAGDVVTFRYESPETINVVAGSVQSYINAAAMSDRDHADHVTHAFFQRGEDAEDNYEALGVKLIVTGVEDIEQDNQSQIKFEGLAANFRHEDLVRPNLSGAIVGGTPLTVATGNGSFVRIAELGADFGNDADDYAYSVSLTPGVTSKPVAAVGGVNGLVGYHVDGIDGSMVEVAVEYSDQWLVAFEAGTEYHLLTQVGLARDQLYGWYAPRLAFEEEPQRGESSNETSMILKFRMLEYETATAQTGNPLEKWRSKLHHVSGA